MASINTLSQQQNNKNIDHNNKQNQTIKYDKDMRCNFLTERKVLLFVQRTSFPRSW